MQHHRRPIAPKWDPVFNQTFQLNHCPIRYPEGIERKIFIPQERHYHSPVHVTPSPVNPAAHTQLKDPAEFTQS